MQVDKSVFDVCSRVSQIKNITSLWAQGNNGIRYQNSKIRIQAKSLSNRAKTASVRFVAAKRPPQTCNGDLARPFRSSFYSDLLGLFETVNVSVWIDVKSPPGRHMKRKMESRFSAVSVLCSSRILAELSVLAVLFRVRTVLTWVSRLSNLWWRSSRSTLRCHPELTALRCSCAPRVPLLRCWIPVCYIHTVVSLTIVLF